MSPDATQVRRTLASSPEATAMESAHEYGISFTHHTSSLILTHALYFSSLMELVRRTSGKHDLALPWLLPHSERHVDLLNAAHPDCLDCKHSSPQRWTKEQVAVQVREAGLQGLLASSDIAGTFLRHKVTGRLLLNMTTPAHLRRLGVPRAAEPMLLPWVQRLRQVLHGRNWGAGVHCCAALAPSMPTLDQWRRMLEIPAWGPLRPEQLLDAMAQRHYVSRFLGKQASEPLPLNASSEHYRYFVEWFKPAHELHQMFHVASGPCTAACSTAPSCHSNNCEFLLPLHAGYDMLLGLWMRRHGAAAPCDATDPRHDFDVDECLPWVFPLTSVRSLCENRRAAHIYEGESEFA